MSVHPCPSDLLIASRLPSRLHVAGSEEMLQSHGLPPEVRLCGKLETLDRILPKLHATGHKVRLHIGVLSTQLTDTHPGTMSQRES